MFKQGKNTVKESVKNVESRRISLVDKLIELDTSKRFARNDKGSAELFSTVFKDVSRYNPTQKDWMHYNGIKWVADIEGMRAKRNAKKLADALLSYEVSNSELDEKQRESYLKYASRLMNYRDRNTMVNDAKDLNYFENEELDKEDFLLNCQNCVLDLSGDKPTVLRHNVDLLLSKVCNANYEPAATCELWIKTIYEIMEGDTEKIKYIQKVFGLSLTGRDRVTARFLHQNEFSFTPRFKLILNTNYLPTITDNPPAAIQHSTEEYESDSDKIGRFISECLVKSDKNVSAKAVYETYSKWCSDSGLGIDGRNNFYIELRTRNLFSASGTIDGKTVRNVTKGYVLVDEEFIEIDNSAKLPFD